MDAYGVFQRVVEIVGPWPLWPSYVLEYWFRVVPTEIDRVTLSAFFYGNAVPLELFITLYEHANVMFTATRVYIV